MHVTRTFFFWVCTSSYMISISWVAISSPHAIIYSLIPHLFFIISNNILMEMKTWHNILICTTYSLLLFSFYLSLLSAYESWIVLLAYRIHSWAWYIIEASDWKLHSYSNFSAFSYSNFASMVLTWTNSRIEWISGVLQVYCATLLYFLTIYLGIHFVRCLSFCGSSPSTPLSFLVQTIIAAR